MQDTRDTDHELPAAVRQFDELPDAALIGIPEIALLLGQGVSTTWRRAASDPNFPRLVKLGQRCTRATVGDVRRYLRGEAA